MKLHHHLERGVTLIEMIIVIGISGLIVAALSLFTTRGFSGYREQFKQILSVEQARTHLTRLNAELQNAADADINNDGIIQAGEGWLIKGTANELSIYTNVDSDPELEIAHYVLSGANLTRGIIQPVGGTYPVANEVTTTIDTHIRNQDLNRPLFTYYSVNDSSNPLSQAAVTADSVYRVDMNAVVDADVSRAPSATDIKTSTVPRLGTKAVASIINNRLWPLYVDLPADPFNNDQSRLTWTDAGSGAQTSQIVPVKTVNADRLKVYDRGYKATINYQSITVGSNGPGWYAYVGPILIGTAGSQNYYQTDQLPLSAVCEGTDLAAMQASCPSRTVTLGAWTVQYQPILTYTDPAAQTADYLNNVTTTYATGSPTPTPTPSFTPSPSPVFNPVNPG